MNLPDCEVMEPRWNFDVAVVTSAHRADDVRIYRKECRALVSAGYRVLLIAPEPATSLAPMCGVTIVAVGRSSRRWVRIVLGPIAVFKAVLSSGVRVVHAHDPELLPLLLVWKLFKPSRRAIYDAHESLPKQVMSKSYIPSLLRRLVSLATRLLLLATSRICDGVVCATAHIERDFSAGRRSVVVQNFPWVSDFPEPKMDTMGTLGDLCFVGSVSSLRGLPAMQRLSESWLVNIAGPISTTLMKTYPGPKYIGQIKGEEIPQFVSGHKCGLAIFARRANSEYGVPTKVFEYMASGRPFVVTDLPGCVDLFSNGAGGIVVDTDDEEKLFEAISSIVDNPDRAVRLGVEGREAFLARFSFDGEAAKLIAFYLELGIKPTDTSR